MTPFFTLIIPIYNTEQYLQQCLESVSMQSYTNFEVIVIDDFSPNKKFDKSGKQIYQEIVASDPRFHYISLVQNVGASGARNIGTDMARGELLVFLDSGDYLDPEHLQNIFDFIKNLNLSAVELSYTYFQLQEAQIITQNSVGDFDLSDLRDQSVIQNQPRNWNYTKELVYFSCSMPLLVWPRNFIGSLRFNPEFNLGEEPEFMARKFIDLQKNGLKIGRLIIPTKTLFHRKYGDSALVLDKKNKLKESLNYIKIYQYLLQTKSLNTTQTWICSLALTRFKLLSETAIISKVHRKTLTFISKILVLWWI